jgi:hypothetical protein
VADDARMDLRAIFPYTMTTRMVENLGTPRFPGAYRRYGPAKLGFIAAISQARRLTNTDAIIDAHGAGKRLRLARIAEVPTGCIGRATSSVVLFHFSCGLVRR